MKRIYLLLVLLLSMAANSFAQKDIKVFSYNRNPDTIKYNAQANGGPFVRYVYVWGFKNVGTVPFTQADTIKFRSWAYNYSTLNLILPAAGIKVGDTVTFRDTIGWVGGPKGNFQMCDSVWTKTGATVNTENVSDNKICRTVYWMQDPLSVKDFDANTAALAVYPNPANNVLNLNYDFGPSAKASVKITDILGRVIYSKELGSVNGMQQITMDISNASAGLHMVELTVNNQKHVAKIMVGK